MLVSMRVSPQPWNPVLKGSLLLLLNLLTSNLLGAWSQIAHIFLVDGGNYIFKRLRLLLTCAQTYISHDRNFLAICPEINISEYDHGIGRGNADLKSCIRSSLIFRWGRIRFITGSYKMERNPACPWHRLPWHPYYKVFTISWGVCNYQDKINSSSWFDG